MQTIPSAHVELIPAARVQQPILANLLELYMHDFSEFLYLDIGPDGKFGYPHLSLYWSEPDRHPFIVRVSGKLAGLVLVKKEPGLPANETVWDMAEFFILRAYRKRGIGTNVAHQVWSRFPGRWQVRVMQSNVSARDFWAHDTSKFTGEAINPVRIDKAGERWRLFSFDSAPDA